jgi:hypothetical protein
MDSGRQQIDLIDFDRLLYFSILFYICRAKTFYIIAWFAQMIHADHISTLMS